MVKFRSILSPTNPIVFPSQRCGNETNLYRRCKDALVRPERNHGLHIAESIVKCAARTLQARSSGELSYSKALEQTIARLGYPDWNTGKPALRRDHSEADSLDAFARTIGHSNWSDMKQLLTQPDGTPAAQKVAEDEEPLEESETAAVDSDEFDADAAFPDTPKRVFHLGTTSLPISEARAGVLCVGTEASATLATCLERFISDGPPGRAGTFPGIVIDASGEITRRMSHLKRSQPNNGLLNIVGEPHAFPILANETGVMQLGAALDCVLRIKFHSHGALLRHVLSYAKSVIGSTRGEPDRLRLTKQLLSEPEQYTTHAARLNRFILEDTMSPDNPRNDTLSFHERLDAAVSSDECQAVHAFLRTSLCDLFSYTWDRMFAPGPRDEWEILSKALHVFDLSVMTTAESRKLVSVLLQQVFEGWAVARESFYAGMGTRSSKSPLLYVCDRIDDWGRGGRIGRFATIARELKVTRLMGASSTDDVHSRLRQSFGVIVP